MNFKNEIFDVIVIGGGASGASAAYYLKKKKKDLKILIIDLFIEFNEAKDRLGGRTQTVQVKGNKDGKLITVDAGGQWVTDTQKNVTQVLKELNIETFPQFDKGKKILEHNGNIVSYNSSIPNISYPSIIELGLNLNKINSFANRTNVLHPFENLKLARSLDSENLEQSLFKYSISATSRSIVRAAFATIFGLELNQVNTLYGAMYVKTGGSIERLSLSEPGCAQEKRGGTQQISSKLIDYVLANSDTDTSFSKVLLNTVLVEIIQNPNDENDLVKVVTQDTVTQKVSTFNCKRVISSIPINQYIHVKFTPELPNFKRNVFKYMVMGNLLKFVVTYETAFWREAGFSGEVVTDGSILELDINTNNTNSSRLDSYKQVPKSAPVCIVFDATTSSNDPALVGFIGADQLVEWMDHGIEARKIQVIKSLVRWFGEKANDYVEYFEKNWNEEKYSGGCPSLSVTSPGVMKDFVRATREPFLNVHFCGTESATEWAGYIDGAIESGIRCSNECLFKLLNDSEMDLVDFEKTYYFQEKLVKEL